jgi:hypothetical protein
MSGEPTISELEKRIAVVRENIAGLVEQAAAFSGARDEARTADRIAEQEQELARLIGNRGKSRGGGTIIRFSRRRESDSLRACCCPRTLTIFRLLS